MEWIYTALLKLRIQNNIGGDLQLIFNSVSKSWWGEKLFFLYWDED